MILASTVAHRRSNHLAAHAGPRWWRSGLAVGAAPVIAAGPGGTQAAACARAARPRRQSKTVVSLHVTTVRITRVSCTPTRAVQLRTRTRSPLHGTLLLEGVGLKAGMVVAFPRSPGAPSAAYSPAARLRLLERGLIVTVPANAHSGRIMVLLSNGRYTSSFGPIYVYKHALHPPASGARTRAGPRAAPQRHGASTARACGSGT